ncbi:MAG: YciI family protein [Pseudomonadota bacterium]
MQYLLLVYIDPPLLAAAAPGEFDTEMRQCLQHADEMARDGSLLGAQQLEDPATAKTVRVRRGKTSVLDGPFAETKEVLAGYNVVEAGSLEEAVRMAQEFPWTKYGSIEVRPIRDIAAVRRQVGA